MNPETIGKQMMTAATKYPNDTISNELARVGALLFERGERYLKKMPELDMMVVRFFMHNKEKMHVQDR